MRCNFCHWKFNKNKKNSKSKHSKTLKPREENALLIKAKWVSWKRGTARIELATSRTQSENHTTRPSALTMWQECEDHNIYKVISICRCSQAHWAKAGFFLLLPIAETKLVLQLETGLGNGLCSLNYYCSRSVSSLLIKFVLPTFLKFFAFVSPLFFFSFLFLFPIFIFIFHICTRCDLSLILLLLLH